MHLHPHGRADGIVIRYPVSAGADGTVCIDDCLGCIIRTAGRTEPPPAEVGLLAGILCQDCLSAAVGGEIGFRFVDAQAENFVYCVIAAGFVSVYRIRGGQVSVLNIGNLIGGKRILRKKLLSHQRRSQSSHVTAVRVS